MMDTERQASRCMEFSTRDFNKFLQPFPNFQEPKEIGSFSVDCEGYFYNDARNCRYFYRPVGSRPKFNLSDGYKDAIRKNQEQSSGTLDMMLRFILANKRALPMRPRSEWDAANECRLQADFVCYRGLLTRMAYTPYETEEGWILCATKYLGTVYLRLFQTEAEIARRAKVSDRQDLMSFWGFKFEHYVTASEPDGLPELSRRVNEIEEYCSVCTTKLGSHRILYGAEIDCKVPTLKEPQSMTKYIELKTNREITTEQQDWTFRRFKLPKWWLQSYLIGIREIVCGFRDDAGIVQRLHTFNVGELPKIAGNDVWSPCICFNFLEQLLSFVKQHVVDDDPEIVYKFEWSPGQTTIQCEQLRQSSEFSFLPDWFVTDMLK